MAWRRTWTPEDFDAWATRCGLSAPQAAAVLELSERNVQRIRSGRVGVKDGYTAKAIAFEEASRTTTGQSAVNLDGFADDENFALLCERLPLAHVSSLTSAIARGWTSAMTNRRRTMSQPIRMAQPEKIADWSIDWTASDGLPWGVECRRDAEGRPYRIASIERTIIDLIVNVDVIGEPDVVEAIVGAFRLSEQLPDMAILRARAAEVGGDVPHLLDVYMNADLEA